MGDHVRLTCYASVRVSGSSLAPRSSARAARSSSLSPRLQTLQAVVGCVLVRLALGRRVERAVDEVVDRPARIEHGLPEMDELGSVLAEDMDSEQPPAPALEDELDESLRCAGDGRTGVVFEPPAPD